MNKKFLSLVLALVMVLGTFSSVFAAPAEKKETKEAPKAAETVVPKITGKRAKIQWLQDNKYVEGRKVNKDPKNNDLALDKNIQRDEVSKLLVYAIGLDQKADALKGAYKFYNDVDLTHWANGYINVGSTEPSKANNLPFLLGYPGKVFKPVNNVTYAELAKMLVTLTKTDLTKDMHDQANKEWPVKWMAWAHDLGIFEDVTVADANKAVNREDAFTMIYNAMYKLKYINKMPVGEVRGILSQIKNNEITINQGDKAKTLKFTPNTTFVLYQRNNLTYDVNVNPHHSRPAQIVFAGAVSNPQYYYGSFVRVISNDKGEVTHVLELGNPADLAIGVDAPAYFNDDADRWANVADGVAETRGNIFERDGKIMYQDYKDSCNACPTLGKDVKEVPVVLAKLNYNGNGDAKSLTFQKGKFSTPVINQYGQFDQSVINWKLDKAEENLELLLTKNTKYYVADAAKNQLTEVNSVDEAIRILGNTAASNWFDNVYAGYDKFGDIAKHETSSPTNIKGYREATVVVFNRVQKDNNNEMMLRVKNEATSLYDITFEDENGNVIMNNVQAYRAGFPYDFKDAKFNVVNYSFNNASGIKVEKVIEHSKTDKFPIVKVEKFDGRELIVKDVNNDTARLQLASEAKVFIKGQLRDGALIQFRTLAGNVAGADATLNNRVDVVSVLPSTLSLKGTLQGVVLSNQSNIGYAKNVKAADIKEYNGTNNHYKVIVNQLNSFYDTDNGVKRDLVWMSKSETEALQAWLAMNGDSANIRYLIKDNVQGNENEVYDVEVLLGDKWVKVDDYMRDYAKHTKDFVDAVDKAPKLADIPSITDPAKVKELTKTLKDLSAQYEALDQYEKANPDVKQRLGWLNNKIVAHNKLADAEQLPAFVVEAE